MFLISFKYSNDAHTFVDYMATKGIVIYIVEGKQGESQLFLNDSDLNQLAFIQQELEKYIKNPNDKCYLDAAWQKGKPSSLHIEKQVRRSVLPRIMSVGIITISMTIFCIALYFLVIIFSPQTVLGYLGYPLFDNNNQLWRYLTPIFIHFSLMHLIFNLMWWWYLGGMVEKIKGKFKLIEITLIAGIFSNYAEASISGPYFGGLSGVVYALMAYVWLYGERIPSSGLHFDRIMIGIAIIWLIAGYIGILGPIANTAHLVGLIIGLLLAIKDIWLLNGEK